MKPFADDKALLQTIYDASSVAIFLVDLEGRIVHANRRMGEMFFCPVDDLVGREYVSLIHPSEREVGRQKMLTLLARGVTSVNLERLYWRRDGTTFWGQLTGQALLDRSGRTTGLVGNIADIDKRKEVERELEASRQRFDNLARTVPCVLYDYVLPSEGKGRFLYLNARCLEFFEVAPEVLMADIDCFWQLVHGDDRARLRREDEVANQGEKGQFVSEVRIVTPSGQQKWIRISSRPNPEPGDQPVVWSGFMLDITQAKAMEEELRLLATTDAMTGMSNRSHFLTQVSQELQRQQRHCRPTSVLMLDLDYFKRINDTHGHGAGDEVLRDFSRRVQALLRSVDLCGRMGGEEFCILLPDTDLAGAKALGQRICTAVSSRPARVETGVIPYTVSIGVAQFNSDDRCFDTVLARADTALYQAKRHGRDQVVAL